LQAIDVPRDGHCQFEAIARQIRQSGQVDTTYRDVRRAIANWLQAQDGTQMHGFLEHRFNSANWDEFCERIKGDANQNDDGWPQWGDHITLVAAANVYQRRIQVWLHGGAEPLLQKLVMKMSIKSRCVSCFWERNTTCLLRPATHKQPQSKFLCC
jgi:hypothetical protein